MSVFDGVRLLVATPVDGEPAQAMCALGYAQAVGAILAEHRDAAATKPGLYGYPADLVRARTRAVLSARRFKATHVLWLDSDNVPKPNALEAMLATGYDWVGCPYPRKKVYWDRVGQVSPEEQSEWHAYDYAYHHTSGEGSGVKQIEVVNGCVPVERLSIGCTLTSMRALDAIWEHFKEIDWFTDVVEGVHFDCVAIFNLLFGATQTSRGKPFRPLFSEDYSVCERYNVVREAYPERGFAPIQMLVTHPADHVGSHLFRGSAEGLVYAR